MSGPHTPSPFEALPGDPPNRREGTEGVESLDYEVVENRPYRKYRKRLSPAGKFRLDFERWAFTFVIGATVGCLAYGLNFAERKLSGKRFKITGPFLHDHSLWPAFWIFAGACTGLVLVAMLAVNFVEDAAAGSGLPEIKAYLNGVNVPRVLRFKTLMVKCIAAVLSVAGGMFVGIEEPLVHIAAIVGGGLPQGRVPSLGIDTAHWAAFRNDHDKRDFVAAGAAAGVSVAFGAPIGGVLFSLEEVSSFWDLELTLRTLFCSMISAFTFNLLESHASGYFSVSGFVQYETWDFPGYHIAEIVPFAVLSVLGGLLGALFNALNIRVVRLRSRVINNRPWLSVLEGCALAFVTACVTFGVPLLFACRHDPAVSPTPTCPVYCFQKETINDHIDTIRFTCAEHEYNPMASLMFITQPTALRQSFSRFTGTEFTTPSLVVLTIVLFLLTAVTYGSSIPAGFIGPGILIGSTFGRVFARVVEAMFPRFKSDVSSGVYALIGASSVLGGTTHMSISLIVILFETTNDVSYLIPIAVGVLVSKWVSSRFVAPLTHAQMRAKALPFLDTTLRREYEGLRASDVMCSSVVTLAPIVSVERVAQVLGTCSHNGFPVVAPSKVVVGLILRSQLRVLLVNRVFQLNSSTNSDLAPELQLLDFYRLLPPGTSDASVIRRLSAQERQMFINLSPYLSPDPHEVSLTCSLQRAYRLFRTMGLRHLLIVDSHRTLQGIVTRKDLLDTSIDHRGGAFQRILSQAHKAAENRGTARNTGAAPPSQPAFNVPGDSEFDSDSDEWERDGDSARGFEGRPHDRRLSDIELQAHARWYIEELRSRGLEPGGGVPSAFDDSPLVEAAPAAPTPGEGESRRAL